MSHTQRYRIALALAVLSTACYAAETSPSTGDPKAKLVALWAKEFATRKDARSAEAAEAFLTSKKVESGSPLGKLFIKHATAIAEAINDGLPPDAPDFWTYVAYKTEGVPAESPSAPNPNIDQYLTLKEKIALNERLATRYAEAAAAANTIANSKNTHNAGVVEEKALEAKAASAAQEAALLEKGKALSALSKIPEPTVATLPVSRITQAQDAGTTTANGMPLQDVSAGGPKHAYKYAYDSVGGFKAMFGARMITPFKITTAASGTEHADDNGKISSTETNTRPVFELSWSSFWTTNAERKKLDPCPSDFPRRETFVRFKGSNASCCEATPSLFKGWDTSARISLLLPDNSTKDSLTNMTTLAGAGDINAEIGVDKLLLGGVNESAAWSLGFGPRIAVSANKSERKAHWDTFLGFHGNLTGFLDKDTGPRTSLLRFGLGAAQLDTLQYADASKTMVTMTGIIPKYKKVIKPAFEAEIWYPIKNLGTFRISSRLYGNLDPTPWSVEAAYSVDLDSLMNGLFGTSTAKGTSQ